MRVLAIDPAIRNTGYAVVDSDCRTARALASDVITIPTTLPGAVVVVALTILAGVIQLTASALAAHADIRALPSYKSLRSAASDLDLRGWVMAWAKRCEKQR